MKYMREDLDPRYGFLELQDKILEIAVYVDKLCKENNIGYCLMGGSALGSKRHGGFIPWDDDLDIFMTPDQYEKFRNCFNMKGDKEKFYLQEWGAIDGMVTISKIRMNNTTYVEESLKNWDIHHGIYIDIFILHRCPNNILKQIWQCLWGKYVIMKGLAIRGYNRRGGFLGLALKVMAMMPDFFLVRYGLRQVYSFRNDDTDYYCNFLGKAIFKNAIYKREYFDTTVYAPFEKIQLRVSGKLHEFLTDRFGDYMKPPSPDRIKWEQHAEFWDINNDYSITLKKSYSLVDEKKLI